MIGLITNRSERSVETAKSLNKKQYDNMFVPEKLLYTSGLGAYRHTDLNRVGTACKELYEALTEAGYEPTGYVELKTDWTDSDRPTWDELNEYIATVAAIKATLPTITPIPTTMRRLTTEGANNIEKMLIEIDEILARLQSIYLRSGVFNSGYQFYAMEATT